jgi:ABC-type multidrug transport system ATPase subunit
VHVKTAQSPCSETQKETVTETAIETSSLTRRYGELTAVDNLSLSVPKGSVYGFLGPNGAGKTTTIRMLLGLIRPNEGRVELLGVPLEQKRISALQHVGALVESPSFYPHLTGYENLEVTRRLLDGRPEQIDRALAIVKLERDAHRRVREYSLGMRQRLGLALALLNEPALLILDEPTNGLDPAGIHEIRELILRLPVEHDVTVFLSSHLLNEVEQVATHIGVLQRGRLLFQGTIGELQTQRLERVQLGITDTTRALQILKSAGWTVQPDGEYLAVTAKGRTDALAINKLLSDQGLGVFHLAVEQPSLEKIFLRLTDPEGEERSRA